MRATFDINRKSGKRTRRTARVLRENTKTIITFASSGKRGVTGKPIKRHKVKHRVVIKHD